MMEKESNWIRIFFSSVSSQKLFGYKISHRLNYHIYSRSRTSTCVFIRYTLDAVVTLGVALSHDIWRRINGIYVLEREIAYSANRK